MSAMNGGLLNLPIIQQPAEHLPLSRVWGSPLRDQAEALGVGDGPTHRLQYTLERRDVPEKVDELARLAHTTTAKAGASMTSPLGGGCGIGRPASRNVVM